MTAIGASIDLLQHTSEDRIDVRVCVVLYFGRVMVHLTSAIRTNHRVATPALP
jgi:hypothetical protein